MLLKPEIQLDFQDLLIAPGESQLGTRKDVDLVMTLPNPHCKEAPTAIPIFNSNMGPFSFSFVEEMILNGCFGVLHKWESEKDLLSFQNKVTTLAQQNPLYNNLFFTIGMSPKDIELLKKLSNESNNLFSQSSVVKVRIDSPNGHNQQFLDAVKRCRDAFGSNVYIIAGNIVTEERTEKAINAGADMVMIGIGSGNHCSSRIQAGVGRPQASAVMECAKVARANRSGVVSDGGIKVPGDAAKAFCLGAHGVMIGTMFGGAKETAEQIIETKNGPRKLFYGSASKTAHEKFSPNADMSYKSFEGIESTVPYTGPLKNTLDDLKGGIRSTGSFIGADKLKDFYKKAILYRVNHQISRIGK